MGKKRGKGRVNVYFRQTMQALKGARQARIFAKVNRNLPYNAITFSKKIFAKQAQKLGQLKKMAKKKQEAFLRKSEKRSKKK